ncbi:MAG TPA: phosphatase PAP2 family protein [Allosphingosinicella sp.]|uniref:phosphatase PAP2 family protein n=1 Tax=Allosphingosinicella sp. TaxID=2823234 RepID=UPI002ED8022D
MKLESLRQDIAASITANRPFVTVAALYWLTILAVFLWKGLPFFRPSAYLSNVFLYIAAFIGVAGPAFVYRLLKERPESPFAFVRHCVTAWKVRERLILAAPAVLTLIVFLPAFSALKSAIPAFSPFSFDPQFIALDRAIHGTDPWRLIHPLVGYPFVSFLLNGAYHLWILLLYIGALLVAGWVERPEVRLQFLISYVLCWALVGSLAAIGFSSVGPCFYDDFYGSDYFSPLMNYLADADRVYPLAALDVQQQLLEWAALGSHGLGRGITAMPSMHLSIACLFAVLGWRISVGWGVGLTAFMILILLGSVHLGYHYAVDGYAAIIATAAIWQGVGWCLRFSERRSERHGRRTGAPLGPALAR